MGEELSVEKILKGEFDIEIPNFKKWNPDTRAHRKWFALSVDWNTDPKVIRLGMGERAWWVCLLTEYAKSPSRVQGVTTTGLNRVVGAFNLGPTRSLLKLAKSGLIILKRSALHTYKTDITDKTDRQHEPLQKVVAAPVKKVPLEEKKELVKNEGSTVWILYCDSYRRRYGVEPVRNRMANIHCKQLVGKLGAEEAPQVAAFYISHNDSFYLKMGHPLGLLVSQAEKLRTEWKTGKKTTLTRANENSIAIMDQLERVKRGEL